MVDDNLLLLAQITVGATALVSASLDQLSCYYESPLSPWYTPIKGNKVKEEDSVPNHILNRKDVIVIADDAVNIINLIGFNFFLSIAKSATSRVWRDSFTKKDPEEAFICLRKPMSMCWWKLWLYTGSESWVYISES